MYFYLQMSQRPPRSTRPDTHFPSRTLFRSRADRPPRPRRRAVSGRRPLVLRQPPPRPPHARTPRGPRANPRAVRRWRLRRARRSEEHTSELQSLMRISYAVFCLKKKKTKGLLRNKQQVRISQIPKSKN